jgi:class 3 adenylate cyclase/tetratricopeptide (TPR) repeat protein
VRCPSCSTENEPGRKFCHECGTRLVAGCPVCGATNPPGAKFCGECGAGLQAEAGAEPAGESAQSATERRVVSILFADLVGFTTLTEGRDAEEIGELQDRYFSTARVIIERYGGTVEKFIGDAVMAIWGAPTAFEDDSERAVRAALDLVDAVGALGLDSDGPRLAARAAVMTGEAAVALGAVGQGLVSGDLVSATSRLQSVAPPGGVLIDEPTRRATESAIAAESAGDLELRGKAAPVAAFRAIGVIAMRRGGGRVDRLEPPFVGRDAELRLLKDLLHAVDDERRARLVSVTGIAGIGKSRLAWELEKYIDGIVDDVYWHQGRSPAYGEGIAFWALAEMVRGRAGIAEVDDAETTRTKLAATLEEYVPDETARREIEPWLQALLGLQEARGEDQEKAFAAARRLLERIAERGLVVLVFEDLQWADSGLVAFIESILEWSRNHRILIVTLARPELLERRPTWGAGQRNFTALHLEPLSDEAMTELLDGVAPGLPRPFVRRIVERAAGVPLFAVETFRMLVDEGRLVPVDGRYRLQGDVRELAIPESLRGLIAARLDGLATDERSLLQDASVLGQTLTIGALTALTGRPTERLEPSLRILVRQEILTLDEDPRSPERGQYTFVQGLIREVVYETLAKKERRARHLAAARYFETLDSEELAGILASHYLDAYRATPEGPGSDALAAQARVALRGAADRATKLGSNDLALGYLEKALTVTTDPAERAATLDAAAGAAMRATRFDVTERYANDASEWYRSIGDLRGVARMTIRQTQPHFELGRTAEAIELLESALAACSELADEPEVVALQAELGRAFMLTYDPRALETTERAIAAAERLEVIPILAGALVTKAAVLDLTGRPVEGIALLRGAIELASANGLTNVEQRGLSNLANQVWNDDPRAAEVVVLETVELARSLGSGDHFRWATWSSMFTSVSLGDWNRALEILDELEGSNPGSYDQDDILSGRAVVAALQGDAASAKALLAAAEAVASDVSRPEYLASRHHNRSRIAGLANDLEGAFDEATIGANLAPGLAYAALAMRWALLMRDLGKARSAYALVTAATERGRYSRAIRRSLEAGLAALEGGSEAAEGYRSAAAALRELDLPFDLGLCLLEFATLVGPEDPGARTAAVEAGEIFTRLGSPPLLERLRIGVEHWSRPGSTGSAAVPAGGPSAGSASSARSAIER